MSSFVSTKNSTSGSLASDATYTGTGEEVFRYSSVTVNIFSTENGATNGIKIEFSQDNSNWDQIYIDTYYANKHYHRIHVIASRYYRIVYVNGSAGCTYRIQSVISMVIDSDMLPAPSASDAFDRIRVCDPYTLLQISHNAGKSAHWVYESTTTGGTSTHQTAQSAVDMAVDTTNAAQVLRQSRLYTPYQPGKSLLIMLTGVLNANSNGTDCISRIGYFDTDDGIYFEYTSSTVYVVKRSSTTNTRVAQSAWNVDPMDGTGPSGLVLDASKVQIFVIDMQWLGSGSVRLGFDIENKIKYVHIFIHANLIGTTYMSRATLPIRYQITNNGTTSGSGTLKMICGTVISEGGFEPLGEIYSATRASELTATTTLKPLISIRVKSTFPKNPAKLSSVQTMSTATNIFAIYFIYLYQSPSSDTAVLNAGTPSWTSAGTNSIIEYDTAATGMTTDGGRLIHVGYVSKAEQIGTVAFNAPVYLTSDADGKPDILVLSVKTTSSSGSVIGAISWTEFIT